MVVDRSSELNQNDKSPHAPYKLILRGFYYQKIEGGLGISSIHNLHNNEVKSLEITSTTRKITPTTSDVMTC